MEIITGVERRRRWRIEDKLRIVSEVEQPGMSVAAVARRHEISRGLLDNWPRQFREEALTGRRQPQFVPLQIVDGAAPARSEPQSPGTPPAVRAPKRVGVMEIDLGGGRRVR